MAVRFVLTGGFGICAVLAWAGAAFAAAGDPPSPSDFFCRPLSANGALIQGIQGQSMAWSPQVNQTWNQNPALQQAVDSYIQQVAGQPKFFTSGAGSCVSASGLKAKGMCQQNVECAYVDPALQKQVEQTYSAQNNGAKVSFAQMDPTSKENYTNLLKLNGTLDWKMATVTCLSSGNKENGVPTCPPPDQCKNDVGSDGTQAVTDMAAVVQQNPIGVNNLSNPVGVGN